MKWLACLVMMMAFSWAGVVRAAEPPVGKWNTVDEKTGKVTSEVELYEQGGKLFGKVTSLPNPNDANGNPLTFTAGKGADKGQPIVGLVIIKNLSLKGDRYKGGTILDPNDGKIYKAEVWMEGGKLKVRGYIGWFYRTQTWVKGQ